LIFSLDVRIHGTCDWFFDSNDLVMANIAPYAWTDPDSLFRLVGPIGVGQQRSSYSHHVRFTFSD
jgi:hypothetical protein